jgi:AAA domain
LRLSEKGKICGKWIKEIKDKYDYCIVDEKSMVNGFLWERLVELKRLTGMTFILVGDPRQCPPIEAVERDYFNHSAVKFLTNCNKVVLEVVHRYDMTLKAKLKNVDSMDTSRRGGITRFNISYFNSTRKYVNNMCNIHFMGEDAFLIPADTDDHHTQDAWVHKRLPVLCRRTAKDGSYVKNERYEVLECDLDKIVCVSKRKDANDEPYDNIMEVKVSEFQKFFLMAYCYTTHKAQGTTIVEDFTIWDWDAMTTKLRYTAMSRATRLEQIYFNKHHVVFPVNMLKKTLTNKLEGHKQYDTKNGFACDLTVDYLVRLFARSYGCCSFCGCDVKTHGFKANDPEQVSIDRLDNNKGHVKGNVHITCWGCNRNRNTQVGDWDTSF